MSNSYRIRTTPGVNKNINVTIDQEFDFIEILSLKILKDQLYTKQCSDYGVIIGRISINNGLGIPNAKVSVFIPLSDEDETNPIISEIYPYKTISNQNEDGYRYNLLPYIPSYEGHIPTGTFFDREDVLINSSLIEVYDKYYKFTTTTNDSGDYMLFGVPVGAQTIFVDLDLSDIGEFSLTPNDLIKMGLATDAMVDGNKFKSSSNLDSLPQIVSFTRNIEIEPLWGEPELCRIGITRTDFDITKESNIRLEPTAIFIGSMYSDIDDYAIKSNCKVKKDMGTLCEFITSSGEIQSIRQTTDTDEKGRPALEIFKLENGGQVIDDDGTWMVDVPMNLDYVITNEFGEKVISPDPSVGVPTKGKYRFKVKWNQAPSLSVPIKRGYYLVPNVREYGWNGSSFNDPLNAKRSYSFSVNWDDYGDDTTTFGQKMINDAINCEDKFYLMGYNKVYTVSQLISEYRKGSNKKRFVGIKRIIDSDCSGEITKFPINDAQHDPDLIYTLYMIMMIIMLPIIYVLLLVAHIVKLIVATILFIISIIFDIIGGILIVIGTVIGWLPGKPGKYGDKIKDAGKSMLGTAKTMRQANKQIRFPLCLMTYPDCENCDADLKPAEDDVPNSDDPQLQALIEQQREQGTSGALNQFITSSNYACVSEDYQDFLAGDFDSKIPPGFYQRPDLSPDRYIISTSLTLNNRMNLFNTKAKYFNNGANNPGGGVNQIKVTFNSTVNQYTTKWHLDNVICLIVNDTNASNYPKGQLITFVDPLLSQDINLTGATLNDFSTNSITGDTEGSLLPNTNIYSYNKTVSYANPTGGGNIPQAGGSYSLTGSSEDSSYARYPMDIEYFQVIHTETVADYNSKANNSLQNSLYQRYIKGVSYFAEKIGFSVQPFGSFYCSISAGPVGTFDNCYQEYDKHTIVFLVRGVDPNTTKTKCRYDLSKLYGYTTFNANPNVIVEDDFHLNIPIQGSFKNVKHTITNNTDTDTYSSNKLYHESYQFKPSVSQFTGFTSGLLRYYSRIDSDSSNNQFLNPGPNGLKVNSGNYFAYEFNSFSDASGALPPNCDKVTITQNSVNQSRGYIPDEIIEGASGLASVFSNIDSIINAGSASVAILSNIYPTLTTNFNLGSNNRQIVMRTDRLPSSSSVLTNGANEFVLYENSSIAAFGIDATGQSQGFSVGTGFANNEKEDFEISGNSAVLDSLMCPDMVPLACYTTDSSNKIQVGGVKDDCNKYFIGKRQIISGGCYNLVNIPLITYFAEVGYVTEWFARNTTTFGVCRGVFSFLFTNNWVNGSLYAFPFKSNLFFDSGGDPYSVQCTDLFYFDDRNNNYYYRSSPYNTDGKFIGDKAPKQKQGNERNLLFPTTMMDLGPKQEYLGQVSITGEFDGYVFDKLTSTSYNDVSELLSFFVVMRLVDGFSIGGVKAFFNSRKYNQKVDGDLAQMLSINSEVGVYPFEAGYYSNNDLYSYSEQKGPNVIGIFYKSDMQLRDFITPKRTILTGEGTAAKKDCAFDDINIFTQEVPLYQWWIKAKEKKGVDTIFGQQTNEWVTKDVTMGGFVKHRYQKLDRLEAASRYMRTTNNSKTKFFKGFIYAVDGSGNTSAEQQYWNKTSGGEDGRQITVGAPFHFFFGAKEGKTAYNKFGQKWIDYDNITF